MDDLQLRIVAGAIITESKLPKVAKIQLLNFIEQEATTAQVKALLMDGEIVYLDEISEQIVHDRWDVAVDEGALSNVAKKVAYQARKAKVLAKRVVFNEKDENIKHFINMDEI